MFGTVFAFVRNHRLVLDRVLTTPDAAEQQRVTQAAYTLAIVAAVVDALFSFNFLAGLLGEPSAVVSEFAVTLLARLVATFVVLQYLLPIVRFVYEQAKPELPADWAEKYGHALPWMMAGINLLAIFAAIPVLGVFVALAAIVLQVIWWVHLHQRLGMPEPVNMPTIVAALSLFLVFGTVRSTLTITLAFTLAFLV